MKFTIRTLALALVTSLALVGALDAHEGEDHGTPEPVAAMPGEALLAATGSGAAFDAVLKYRPFAKGEQVSLTMYLVSSESNRPVGDATVSGSLSEGDKNTTIAFQPKAGGPAGTYSATVTPGTDAAMSWLLDVTAGSESDLIAVTGFKAADRPRGAVAGATSHDHGGGAPPIAIAISLGVLLAVGAFVAGRASARKVVSA